MTSRYVFKGDQVLHKERGYRDVVVATIPRGVGTGEFVATACDSFDDLTFAALHALKYFKGELGADIDGHIAKLVKDQLRLALKRAKK